ncbi:MAG TPA: hypothetical protein VNV66_07640 [Pilimelia sp.]|nr:hypothetical protein [Pilimelia sp.]
MTGHWSDVLQPGSAPPALLRARVVDAEEVLVLSYTADLRFFERVSLAEARAAGARVTVVHDVAADVVPADDVHHAGVHYTDVPVRCRGNGEFHPKLLVVAGSERALVAIGSGNVTASGWHHNGELWTTLAADLDDWPTTFHDLAAWLRELPRYLYIDRFGAARVAAVADTLDRHPARTRGPQLLHNLHTPIAGQLPPPTGEGTDLVFASPFLDHQMAALRRLSTHFGADQVSFAVTINAAVDPDLLTAWAVETGADLYAVADSRYFHGKLVQWSDDDGTHALIGSANITAAAMLRTTGERHGNCELALLCRLGDADLAPPVGDQLTDADAMRSIVAEPRPEPVRDAGTPRLLRVLRDGPGVLVTVVADTAGDIDALLLPEQEPHPLTFVDSDDRVHRLRAETAAVGGSVCHVRLVDGTLLGPVRVTDAVAVEVRPGAASPLQDRRLADVLSDRRLSDRLFQALQELAAARPATTPGTYSAGTGGQPEGWRRAAERTVGSTLVRLALGRVDHDNGEAAQDEGLDPGDVVDETDSDDDGIDLFDDEDHDTGLRDPLAGSEDPVTRLLTDPITAARLAARIDTLVPQTADWHAGALLALMRVTLLVAAGGGWPTPEHAAEAVGAVLRLLTEPAQGDDDVEAARRAAVLVGLAVLAAAVERWDDSANTLVEAFEQCRSLAAINPADIDYDRLAHYAADLDIGFGATLMTDSLLDATTFLLTSTPIERATETIRDEYRNLALAAPRLLRIQSTGNPYGAAMRLLTRLAHLAPVAVHADSPKGGVYAAWQPKTFILQRFATSGTPISGSRHRLAIGPGAHTETPPGAPLDTWRGALPPDLLEHLQKSTLLP